MVISKNSQLGLRFEDREVKRDFLKLSVDVLMRQKDEHMAAIDAHSHAIEDLQIRIEKGENLNELTIEGTLAEYQIPVIKKSNNNNGMDSEPTDYIQLIEGPTKYYYICDSVYEASKLIKIGVGFTSRALKDINFGTYTYLLGKHKMVRFTVMKDRLKGIYYDDLNRISFVFILNVNTGEYYTDEERMSEFSFVMQILTFVELGDIIVVELAGGRNNGKSKNDGKVTNTANYTVYVVDSSWNKIIMRTTGFAVRGHFRLQPCGTMLLDRKLMWINSFEKEGYVRRPKAEISRD